MQGVVAPSHRRWTNRSVAREVDRERARRLWSLILSLLLAAAPIAAYLLEQNECLRLSYETSALRAEQEQLVETERRLRMRRASLESLETIEAWAMTEGRLTHPDPRQVIVIRRSPASGRIDSRTTLPGLWKEP